MPVATSIQTQPILGSPPPVRPIPRSDEPRSAEFLAWGALKDPVGHRVHWWIAMVACFLQPINPVAAAIGQGALIGYSILRLHATWRCLMPLLRSSVVLAALAIMLWTTIAVAWSPDVGKGLGRVMPMRFLLFSLAIWPVLNRPIPFLMSLMLGCSVQAVFQILMFVDWMPNPDYRPWVFNGGLGKHPGNTALWSGCFVAVLFGVLLAEPRRWATLLPLVAAGLVSLILSGSRSLVVALPVGILLVLGRSLWLGRGRGRGRGILVTAVVIGLVVVSIMAATNALPLKRLDTMVTEFQAALVDSNYGTSSGLRLIWWRESLPIVEAAPIIGHGTGSTAVAYESQFDQTASSDIPTTAIGTDNPHSTIVTEAIERGGVGLVLWAVFVLLALKAAWRRATFDPAFSGLFGAWVILFIFGVGNSIQLSGIITAVMGMLIAFTIRRPPVQDPTLSDSDHAATEASPAST